MLSVGEQLDYVIYANLLRILQTGCVRLFRGERGDVSSFNTCLECGVFLCVSVSAYICACVCVCVSVMCFCVRFWEGVYVFCVLACVCCDSGCLMWFVRVLIPPLIFLRAIEQTPQEKAMCRQFLMRQKNNRGVDAVPLLSSVLL